MGTPGFMAPELFDRVRQDVSSEKVGVSVFKMIFIVIIGHFGHALGGIGQTMEKQELEVKLKLKMEEVHDLLATVVLARF